MLIAIDARSVFRTDRRGTGKALVLLYRHACQLRPDWRFIALHRQAADPLDDPVRQPNFIPRRIEMPGDRFDLWEQFRLPLEARRMGADVLHCPANTCPVWTATPMLVTVHDLIPLDMPDGLPAPWVQRFERSVRLAARRAAAITCPSEYTRQRLVQDLGASAHRVMVTPWGPTADPIRLPESDIDSRLARRGITGPFVLHMGANEPRKNTRRLLDAWASIPPALRDHWRLVIVGVDPATAVSLRDRCEESGLSARTHIEGFADETDLAALTQRAGVLAYPSLSEGFGLPILEGWAAGAAMLTGNQTSLPEIAGDAAELVDPTSTPAIADGLHRLMSDPARRSELVRRGTHRLRQFTWRLAAERFVAAIELAASKPGQQAAA